MKVDIDLAADAALMVWGERSKGCSRVVEVPGRGMRLLLSEAGDVVGIEVLGWSHRSVSPSEVVTTIAGPAQVLDETHPLAAALADYQVNPCDQPRGHSVGASRDEIVHMSGIQDQRESEEKRCPPTTTMMTKPNGPRTR